MTIRMFTLRLTFQMCEKDYVDNFFLICIVLSLLFKAAHFNEMINFSKLKQLTGFYFTYLT